MSADNPTFSLARAARICGYSSRETIRRRLKDDWFPNATKDDSGQWQIPLRDLIGAGLSPDLSLAADAPQRAPKASDVQRLRDRADELQAEVDRLTQMVADRDAHLTDLRKALDRDERT